MSMMTFIHVLLVFVAFALTTGVGLSLAVVAASCDAAAIRVAVRAFRPLQIVGGILLIVGALLGFGNAAAAGFSLTAPWLVVTYVCVIALLGLGFGVHQPWAARLGRAAESGGPTLSAVVHEPFPRAAGPISAALWLVVIAMMVLKP